MLHERLHLVPYRFVILGEADWGVTEKRLLVGLNEFL
jgi:hypothetical protein